MRSLVAGLLLALLATGLSSCSNDKQEAQQAAERLAGSLGAGKLPADLFTTGSPQTAYDDIVRGLGDVRPAVHAGDVTQKDANATAQIDWSWTLGEHEWKYATTARLTKRSGAWKVTWSPTLVEKSLSAGETLDRTTLLAERGDILGAHGVALVKDRPVVRFGIDKTRVSTRRALISAKEAADALGVATGPYVKLVRSSGDQAFVEAIVLRPEDARAATQAIRGIRGAVAIDDTMPLAPTREFAAPILGRVGPATAEIVKASDGRVQPGDVVGVSGLQARYDEQLAGTPGVEVEAVDREGQARTVFTAGPVDGKPLRTTLDETMQTRAERVLAVPDPEHPGPATALVAIRPSTGEVLAAANGPGAGGQNIATFGQYAPGSTFKIISSLALLRSGLQASSRVTCPPAVDVNGKQFENYSDYPANRLGDITLRDAVANSCNTAFIGSRDRIKAGTLAEAAASLGFGVDFDLGFPAYFGQVPPAAGETEAAADLIGQGKILASPMVMAAVTASVAAGHTVVPHLLEDQAPEPHPDTPLTGREAAELRGLMRAVVAEGSGTILAGLPGAVGAKTGTAEYGTAGRTHAWMVAFDGDLAVAVFVETGESGSGTAGPLLLDFLS
jgi:cell division protein FtsI/penicillin-binding protein 2